MPDAELRILVTGSRDFTSYTVVLTALRKAIGNLRPDTVVVVSGHQRGADLLAEKAALWLGCLVEPHPAEWRTFGKAAGVIRNADMVALGADLCLAFYQYGAENRGTQDCVDRAKAAGIPIRRSDGW